MKRTFTALFFAALIISVSSAFIVKYQNGAVAGYAGSPGEQICSACHSGGSSTAQGVTVSASPAFINNQYQPDSVYTVSVTVGGGSTTFNSFGFACEVLNTSNTNSGTLQLPGAGVQLLNAGNGRRNATHSSPKVANNNRASFTFSWKAPASGQGNAIFYYCANAVNLNGNTSGDLPIPGSYTLTEGVAPTPTVDAIRKNEEFNMQISIYPNPTSNVLTILYTLKENKTISIDLVEITGRKIKTLIHEKQGPGTYEKALSLHDVVKGLYFVRTTTNGSKVSQKMLLLN